jgi:hypothetical protein
MKERAVCTIAGCGKRMLNKKYGYCEMHYTRMRRYGDPLISKREAPKPLPEYCTVIGCNKKPRSFGLCSAHYTRKRRHGSPEGGGLERGHASKWLLDNVDHDGEDCLIWPYAKSPSGYGLSVYNGKQTNASRIMCELAHGEPPKDKMDAAHSCGNGHGGCVNPKHLRWATRTENHADKLIHGTDIRGEKHHMAKLSEAEVKLIRASEGLASARLLALEYGLSVSMIYRIWRRQAWAHI